MNPRFWNSIASLPTLSALMTVWEYLLGDQFAQAAPFLSPCNLQADYYPCASQHRCQCMHRIIYHSPDEIEAVCECGEGACDSFPLKLDDLRIQSVNLRLLAAALGAVVGFDTADIAPCGPRAWHFGHCREHRAPVVFSNPAASLDLMQSVERIHAAFAAPIVLLTPNARAATPTLQGALNRHGSVHIPLAGTLAILPDGKIAAETNLQTYMAPLKFRHRDQADLERAITRIDRNLAQLAPAPPVATAAVKGTSSQEPDDQARQLFALVKQLDTQSNWRKAPILQVFRLYCLESMTAEEIARRCACAKSLIVLRLAQLRQKLGCDPAALRPYSGHFDRIEASLRDPAPAASAPAPPSTTTTKTPTFEFSNIKSAMRPARHHHRKPHFHNATSEIYIWVWSILGTREETVRGRNLNDRFLLINFFSILVFSCALKHGFNDI